MNATILLQAAQGGGSGMMSIVMIVALFAIFYFFMIRPQQKRQKEIKKFRESLGPDSKIVTAGGIYGTIKEVRDLYFVVEIANGVRIRIDKGSVYPSANDAAQAAQNNENTANK